MAKASVRVDGLTEAKATVARLPESFKAVVVEALEIGGNIILYETNSRVPVWSGKMKASLGRTVREDGLQVAVGFGDPKAKFVEFGTNDTPAQPSLYPAARLGFRFVRGSMRDWADDAGNRARFKTKRSNQTKVKK